jgi:hypothetical protein
MRPAQKKLIGEYGGRTPTQLRHFLWRKYSKLEISFSVQNSIIRQYDREWYLEGGLWPEKSEGEKFLAFFQTMDIWTTVCPHPPDGKGLPKSVRFSISVSQAIFLFDIRWHFLGTLSDEMGTFEKRKGD